MNDWAIIKVRKGTPIEPCSPDVLKTSRSRIGKRGYSYEAEFICVEHEDFHYGCSDCKTGVVTYTDADMLRHATEMASSSCDRTTDCWVVDGETGAVVAAFGVDVTRLI